MDVDVGAGSGRLVEGIDKLGTTVGIDGVVATVVGHHDVFQAVRLSHTHGNGQHDAIAEGYHRRLHILVGIVTLGNLLATLQQRTLKVLGHEVQGNDDMLDAQLLTMPLGKGNLAGIVLRTIVERDSQGDALLLVV